MAAMQMSTARGLGVRPKAPQPLGVAVPRRVVRVFAERDNVGTKLVDKAAETANKAGDNVQRAADDANRAVDRSVSTGSSPLADTPFAKAVRGANENQEEQWRKGLGPEENIILPAFTRNREINAGRAAMVGFFSAVVGEIITTNHLGIIGQVSGWTGLSHGAVGATLVGLIVANLLGGLTPWSSTWDDEVQKDNAKRNAGPTQGNLGKNPNQFLNITALGFTKQNELFNGRMAQLGFLAAIAGETASGHGPLGQLAQYLDWVPNEEYYASAKVGLGLWALFLLASAAITNNWGQKVPGDDNVY